MMTEAEHTSFDQRRDLLVPGDGEATLHACVSHWVETGKAAIAERGRFCVALSGGSTPKKIFERLTPDLLDWSKVYLFWSDERSVGPEDPESNFRMAMDAAFEKLPIPQEQVFRMVAEADIEKNAQVYEENILKHVPDGIFDLVMLGMGEDGHTASLFPHTHALHTHEQLVVSNYVPDKETWRMTFTYTCINMARAITVYVLGDNKAGMVKEVLQGEHQPDELPVQNVGTPTNKALWILDQGAAKGL